MAKQADLREVKLSMSRSAKTALRPAVPAGRQPDPGTKRMADASPSGEGNLHYRPGRAQKSNVTGYFPPEVKKQLRLLAAERETTIQHLLAEALNGMFASNGKPEIVPLENE